jgi:hypothetical protein
LSAGPEADVCVGVGVSVLVAWGLGVGDPRTISVGRVPRVGVAGAWGVPLVSTTGGSVPATSVSSTSGVVMTGSVPRYTYEKRVALGVTAISAGALSERPINKTTIIPMTENPLRKIGIKILRSKAGEVFMENRNVLESFNSADKQFNKRYHRIGGYHNHA